MTPNDNEHVQVIREIVKLLDPHPPAAPCVQAALDLAEAYLMRLRANETDVELRSEFVGVHRCRNSEPKREGESG